jgi:hypothetical protein
MLAIDLKRGVEATLERVFKQSGNQFGKLEFVWSGRTAAIKSERAGGVLNAKVYFPSIDDNKQASRALYNEILGYAIHELGHAWFTDMDCWNVATSTHGQVLFNLINGLEDPRIEQCVIDSGYAPNSKTLFVNLLNSVLDEGGYVQPDDRANIPFMLAVEGRRLNGYPIKFESILSQSPWGADLEWALTKAKKAGSTAEVVTIAIELFKRLNDTKQQEPQEPEKSESEDKQEDKPEDKQGEQSSESSDEGTDEGTDEQSDNSADSDSGEAKPSEVDKPSKPSGKRSRRGTKREVEPSEHIENKIKSSLGVSEELICAPAVGAPIEIELSWWS